MPDPETDALIARARAGNAASIGALYERYQAGVFRYLYYRVGDRQAAEDLTGEVFLRMIGALPRYRQGGVPFKAWIFQIARNLAVDHFRKQSVRDHVGLDEALVDPQEAVEEAADRSLTSEALKAALQSLTVDQREVILLRFVAGMPIAQVAGILNKSESAVKALQRRGLNALRKILDTWNITYG